MVALLLVAAFAAGMAVMNRMLRAKERAGDFDPQSASSAAHAGLRRFFDFSLDGWRGDGVNQRPPSREQRQQH
jgi:hypothetical protein